MDNDVKGPVGRLVDEVMNQRRLSVIDEIYSPSLRLRRDAGLSRF